jgi:BolA family transcriptional regulator, general stress-responsive regulator
VNASRIDEIRAALEARLQPVELEVLDESAAHAGHAGAREGGHYRVQIVSERFRGHSPLTRHRLVYEALGALMGGGIHALAIQALTPDEWTMPAARKSTSASSRK